MTVLPLHWLKLWLPKARRYITKKMWIWFRKLVKKESTLVVFTPRRPTGTRRTGLLPQQRIRDTKTRSTIGNDYTFEQRLVCSRYSWKDHYIHHDGTSAPSVTRRMYRLSRRNLEKITEQTSCFLQKSPYTVIEADEFDRSFHWLSLLMSVITATDPDHLDISGTEAAYLEKFRTLHNPHPAGRRIDHPQRHLTTAQSATRCTRLHLFTWRGRLPCREYPHRKRRDIYRLCGAGYPYQWYPTRSAREYQHRKWRSRYGIGTPERSNRWRD